MCGLESLETRRTGKARQPLQVRSSGGPCAAASTVETVRALYRQRAARCKIAACDVKRPQRATFALCEQQCGAPLDIDAMSAIHHSAMEAAAALNPDNPRASLPALVDELGPAALLCVRAADLESAQLGLLLSICLPACVRQGTVIELYGEAFVPALTAPGAPPADGGAVAADRVHCKVPVRAGARLLLRPGVWGAARAFFKLRCPAVDSSSPPRDAAASMSCMCCLANEAEPSTHMTW